MEVGSGAEWKSAMDDPNQPPYFSVCFSPSSLAHARTVNALAEALAMWWCVLVGYSLHKVNWSRVASGIRSSATL